MMEKSNLLRLFEAILLVGCFCVLIDNACEAGGPFRYPVKYHGHRIPLRLHLHRPHLYLKHPSKLAIRPFIKLVDPTTPLHPHHLHSHPHHHPHHNINHLHPHPHSHPHSLPKNPFHGPYGKGPFRTGRLYPHSFPRGPKFGYPYPPPGGPLHPEEEEALINSQLLEHDYPGGPHSHPESSHIESDYPAGSYGHNSEDYVDNLGPDFIPGSGPVVTDEVTVTEERNVSQVPEVKKAIAPVVVPQPTPTQAQRAANSYAENIPAPVTTSAVNNIPSSYIQDSIYNNAGARRQPETIIENVPTPIDVYNSPSGADDLYNTLPLSLTHPHLLPQPDPLPHHHHHPQLIEKLPGALGLYGYPNDKKELHTPVEKVIRNVKLNEFVCVKKEEGVFAKQLVLSATTKSTFHFDPILGGDKTIVVAHTNEKLCVHGIPKDGRRATALDCNNDDPLLKWDMVPIHYGQFWIQQKGTNYCLQPSTTLSNPLFVEMKACDLYESLQLWDIREAHETHPKGVADYGTY